MNCTGCTACCHHIVVDATAQDIMREPRIMNYAESIGKGRFRLVPRSTPEGGLDYACPFLLATGCSIYQTRPAVCARFKAGTEHCLRQRRLEGRQ